MNTPDDFFAPLFDSSDLGSSLSSLLESSAAWLSDFDAGNNLERISECFAQFASDFPDDETCDRALYQALDESGQIRCRKCSATNYQRVDSCRAVKCLDCGARTWFASDLHYFGGMKSSRARWCFLILSAKCPGMNAHQFSKVTGIPYSTAYGLRRDMQMTYLKMLEERDADRSSEIITVDSFFFQNVYMRRSTLTPAGEKPEAEQIEIDKLAQSESLDFRPDSNERYEQDSKGCFEPYSSEGAHADNQFLPAAPIPNIDCSFIPSLKYEAQMLYSLILQSERKRLTFDDMVAGSGMSVPSLSATLSLLELDGCIVASAGNVFSIAGGGEFDCKSNEKTQRKPAPGNRGILSRDMLYLVDCVKIFVKKFCQGVSRKYFQLYLTDFWRCLASLHGAGQEFIWSTCLNMPKVSRSENRAYVTPQAVTIFAIS